MPTILARVRGLVSPIFADEPLRLGDSTSGGVGIATTSTVGVVRPDDTTISVDGSGIISVIGGGSGGNVTADTHPGSATAWDDEFETGSSINLTRWTAFNLSTGTNSVAAGSLVFSPALLATVNYGGYTQAVPTAPWAFTIKMAVVNGDASTNLGGLLLATSSGSSGHIYLFGPNGNSITLQRASNGSTFSANESNTGAALVAYLSTAGSSITKISGEYVYWQVAYDGTTLTWAISKTGIPGSFIAVFSEASATFLGAPSLIGIGADNQSSSVQFSVIVDWFRRTA